MTYRAENGFGGMNLGHCRLQARDAERDPRKLARNCANRTLFDVTNVKSMI
jgi:hypothetical protein